MAYSRKYVEQACELANQLGKDAGRREAAMELQKNMKAQNDLAKLKLLEAIAQIAAANAQLTTSVHRMMDEGLTK